MSDIFFNEKDRKLLKLKEKIVQIFLDGKIDIATWMALLLNTYLEALIFIIKDNCQKDEYDDKFQEAVSVMNSLIETRLKMLKEFGV